MLDLPEWIAEWIRKDRLVASRYRTSKSHLRQSKRIQFVEGEKNTQGEWEYCRFAVYSPKHGRYNVTLRKANITATAQSSSIA